MLAMPISGRNTKGKIGRALKKKKKMRVSEVFKLCKIITSIQFYIYMHARCDDHDPFLMSHGSLKKTELTEH